MSTQLEGRGTAPVHFRRLLFTPAISSSCEVVAGSSCFPFSNPGTFQAHLADVHSTEDVERVMQVLLANRKIAGATHNIMAYRIYQEHKAAVSQILHPCS